LHHDRYSKPSTLTMETIHASAPGRLSTALPVSNLATPTRHGMGGGFAAPGGCETDRRPIGGVHSRGVAAANRTFWCIDWAAVSWARRPRGLRVMRTTP